MDGINLSRLVSCLGGAHVKLDSRFVNDLLVSSSKSQEPHKKITFIRDVGCPINKNTGQFYYNLRVDKRIYTGR